MPRWRGWISLDATGKFSSRWPFPDRNAAGSLVMDSVKLRVGGAPTRRYRAQHGPECHPKPAVPFGVPPSGGSSFMTAIRIVVRMEGRNRACAVKARNPGFRPRGKFVPHYASARLRTRRWLHAGYDVQTRPKFR